MHATSQFQVLFWGWGDWEGQSDVQSMHDDLRLCLDPSHLSYIMESEIWES